MSPKVTNAVPSSTPRKRSPASLPNLIDIKSLGISEVDIIEWMRLIENRGSTNPLYRMADRFQASLVITGILTIQGIYKAVTDSINDKGKDIDIEELNKLTSAFNRAMTSINQALSCLGLTGNRREEDPQTDALTQFLSSVDLERELPPILQNEFVLAKRNLERVSGQRESDINGKGEHFGEIEKEAMLTLSKLREPLKGYVDTGDDVVKDGVVDVEKDGRIVL